MCLKSPPPTTPTSPWTVWRYRRTQMPPQAGMSLALTSHLYNRKYFDLIYDHSHLALSFGKKGQTSHLDPFISFQGILCTNRLMKERQQHVWLNNINYVKKQMNQFG